MELGKGVTCVGLTAERQCLGSCPEGGSKVCTVAKEQCLQQPEHCWEKNLRETRCAGREVAYLFGKASSWRQLEMFLSTEIHYFGNK